jgi:hypothetical protein
MWYHQQLWTMNQYQKRNPQKQHFTRMILNWLACKFAMTWNKKYLCEIIFSFFINKTNHSDSISVIIHSNIFGPESDCMRPAMFEKNHGFAHCREQSRSWCVLWLWPKLCPVCLKHLMSCSIQCHNTNKNKEPYA